MEKQVIIMGLPDPKKHSVRYNAYQGDVAIDSIYVKRQHLGSVPPGSIKVTIEEVENEEG